MCSITLILSLSYALLKNFYTKIKTIYWSVLKTFLILIVIMFIQYISVHVLLIRQWCYWHNPGSRSSPCHIFSICHWNLNSLTSNNNLKVSLLRAYIFIKKFDWHFYQRPISIRLTYLMMTILIFLVIT